MPDTHESFQEQVAALRRAQILDAATKVFATRGFHRATIRDVAQAAGIADGTIYNYFENKNALLFGIMARMNETERRDADMALSADMDMRAFFRSYFKQRLDVLTQEGLDGFQVVLSEVLVNASMRELYIQRVVEPTFALAETHFTQLVAAGKLKPFDIPLLLRTLAATVVGLLTLRILGDPQLQAKWDALPELLATLVLDGVLPNKED